MSFTTNLIPSTNPSFKKIDPFAPLSELKCHAQFFRDLENEIKDLPTNGFKVLVINAGCWNESGEYAESSDAIYCTINFELSERGRFIKSSVKNSRELDDILLTDLKAKKILSESSQAAEMNKTDLTMDISTLVDLANTRFCRAATEDSTLATFDLLSPTIKTNDWFQAKYSIALNGNSKAQKLAPYLFYLLGQHAKYKLNEASTALKTAFKTDPIKSLIPNETDVSELLISPSKKRKFTDLLR